MSKKRVYDYSDENITYYIEKSTMTLLEIIREGRVKVRVVCDNGHESVREARKYMVENPPKCGKCKFQTVDQAIDQISKHGFTVISNKPKILSDRVMLKCSNGHIKESSIAFLKNSGFKCRECAGKKVTEKTFREEIAKKNLELLTPYTTLRDGGTLRHRECGKEFLLKQFADVYKDTSCPHCFGSNPLTESDLKEFFESIGYSLLKDYQDGCRKVEIQCNHCGKVTGGKVSNYRHRKLPCMCSREDKYNIESIYSKPNTLYYLRIDHEDTVYYKIGITYKTVEDRYYSSDLEKITILSTVELDDRYKALKLERYFLQTFSEYRYKGSPILVSGGNTELFTKDVLELDN